MTKPRRPRLVAHIIDDFDGANYVDFLHELRRLGFAISLTVLRPIRRSWTDQLESVGVHTRSGAAPSRSRYGHLVATLLNEGKGSGVDLIHTHLFDSSVIGCAVGALAGIPILTTRHHGDYHHVANKGFHAAVDGFVARRASAVVAVSASNRRSLITDERVPPSNVHLVHNGIEIQRFGHAAESSLAVRSSLSVTGRTVITVPARLHWVKGHDILLDALASLGTQTLDRLVVFFVGVGPLEQRLRRQARAVGLSKTVRFLGWRTDLAEIMAASDVVVLPSRSEPFGQVIIEAMAARTPVIASCVDGPAELIEDGKSGLLFPPGDSQSLAGVLRCVLYDPALRERLAEGGRRRASDFTVGVMAERYSDIYDRILFARDGTRGPERLRPGT